MLFFREWFGGERERASVLLLQCDSGNLSGDLIACARYIIQDEYTQTETPDVIKHVILIVQLPRVATGNFVGFQVNSFVYMI